MIKNYKTTLPAVLALLAVGLHWSGLIDQQQMVSGIAVLTAAGLMAAKDHDVR